MTRKIWPTSRSGEGSAASASNGTFERVHLPAGDLFRGAQPLLVLLAVGNVHDGSEHALRPALRRSIDAAARIQPVHAAVRPDRAELRGPVLRCGNGAAQTGFDASAIAGMQVPDEYGDAPVRFGDGIAIAEALVMAQRAPRGIGGEIEVPIADPARF